jgi:hypothetical protein
MFDTSSQSFQRQDDQEVDAHLLKGKVISVHRKHEIIEQSGI